VAVEKLVVFDLLTHPGPDLSTEERGVVKKVAQQLLTKPRVPFTQRTEQSRAKARSAIEEALDDSPPSLLHARCLPEQGWRVPRWGPHHASATFHSLLERAKAPTQFC
jgi:hypothetical protein